MKINKVGKICKRQSNIEIVDLILPGEAHQFVGDGVGMYSMDGAPLVDPESAFGLFDIPKTKKKTFSTARFCAEEIGISLMDNLASDTQVFRGPVLLGINGDTYVVLYTDVGIRIIDAAYLEPVSDGPYSLWMRETRIGSIRILVKNVDFELVAVIEPSRIPDEAIDAMRDILQGTRTVMRTDPDTGEIIESLGEEDDET